MQNLEKPGMSVEVYREREREWKRNEWQTVLLPVSCVSHWQTERSMLHLANEEKLHTQCDRTFRVRNLCQLALQWPGVSKCIVYLYTLELETTCAEALETERQGTICHMVGFQAPDCGGQGASDTQ